MGWIFVIVLVICITVVLCFTIYNSDVLSAYVMKFELRDIERRLGRIEQILIETKEGGKDDR